MELGSIFLLLAVILLVGIFISRPLFQRSEPANRVGNSPQQAGDEAVYIAQSGADSDHVRSSLLAEYDRLLNAIQELEFDHTLGKIPPEDYPPERAALLQAGADVLKKLDAIRAAPQVKDMDEDLSLSVSAVARFASAAQKKLEKDGTMSSDTPVAGPAAPVSPELAPVAAPVVMDAKGGESANSNGANPQTSRVIQQGTAEIETDTELERLIADRRQARSEKSSGFCPHCGKPVQKSDRFCPKCGTTL
jgi:hypothetical protein